MIFEENGKFGVCNEQGKVIIPCEYDKVFISSYFTEYYIVEKNDKQGMFDMNGNLVMPCEYDGIYFSTSSSYYYGNDIYCVEKNGKYGLYDLKNKVEVLPCIYDDVVNARFEGYPYGHDSIDCIVTIAGQRGLISNGNKILECEYDDICYTGDKEIKLEKDGKYGICDMNGKIIVPIDYIFISRCDKLAYYIVSKGDHKKGVYSNGKEIVPCEFDEIYVEKTGNQFIFITKKENKLGIFNEQGVMLAPNKFDKIVEVREYGPIYRIKENGKEGRISINNGELKVIIPSEYDEVSYFKYYYTVKKEGKIGLYSCDGNQILPCEYDYYRSVGHISNFDQFFGDKIPFSRSYERLLVGKEGKFGVCDLKGQVIIPIELSKEEAEKAYCEYIISIVTVDDGGVTV